MTRERRLEIQKNYRERHKEKLSEYASQYRKAHRKPIREMNHITHKVCRKCLESKPLVDFNKDTRRRGVRSARGGLGVQAWCRACCAHAYNPKTSARRAMLQRLSDNGFKRCGVCKMAKPKQGFAKRAASKDGLSYTCRECAIERSKQWSRQNPTAFKEWYRENRDHLRQKNAEWRGQNTEHLKASYRRWAKANPGAVASLRGKRHAAKLNATLKWANAEAIKAVYDEAAMITASTGIKHDVDHIIPLRSRLVCGLHIAHNLQVMEHTANLSKGNRFTSHWLRPPSPSCEESGQTRAA